MTQATAQEPHAFTPHNVPDAGTKGSAAQENLELFAAGFFEGAGPALTTVLNRKISVAVQDVVATAAADLLRAVPFPWALVEVAYQRGMSGTHWLLLPQTSAVVLGQIATGSTDTEGADIPRAYQDAIRDAVNQMLLSAGPPLMPLFARSVSFAPVTVRVVEDADMLPQDLGASVERFWLVRAQAKSSDGFEIDMLLTIGADLAREISSLGAEEAPTAGPEARAGEAPPPSKIDMIMDVTLPVTVELGRARMQIQDIIKLAPGSVIELDKSSGDPVELYINDRPIAKGEVVIIDENFGIRLTSIVTTTERIKTLR